MKVLALNSNYPSLSTVCDKKVFLMADSSLAKSGKPWFLPEYAESFAYRPHLVFRVGRLGKNIARRFAHRYIDAVTIGASVEASPMPDSAIANAFDGAAMIGDFIPIEEIPDINNITGLMGIEGGEITSICSADMICKIDEIIEYLSQYFTFKIGDIIYSGFGSEAVTLAIDQVLHGSINGKEVLNIKVK